MTEYSVEDTVEGRWDEYYNGRRKKMEVEKKYYNEWFGGNVGMVEYFNGK